MQVGTLHRDAFQNPAYFSDMCNDVCKPVWLFLPCTYVRTSAAAVVESILQMRGTIFHDFITCLVNSCELAHVPSRLNMFFMPTQSTISTDSAH